MAKKKKLTMLPIVGEVTVKVITPNGITEETPISLGAISGLEIGKYSRHDFADFAGILARIHMPSRRNTCQPEMPGGNR